MQANRVPAAPFEGVGCFKTRVTFTVKKVPVKIFTGSVCRGIGKSYR